MSGDEAEAEATAPGGSRDDTLTTTGRRQLPRPPGDDPRRTRPVGRRGRPLRAPGQRPPRRGHVVPRHRPRVSALRARRDPRRTGNCRGRGRPPALPPAPHRPDRRRTMAQRPSPRRAHRDALVRDDRAGAAALLKEAEAIVGALPGATGVAAQLAALTTQMTPTRDQAKRFPLAPLTTRRTTCAQAASDPPVDRRDRPTAVRLAQHREVPNDRHLPQARDIVTQRRRRHRHYRRDVRHGHRSRLTGPVGRQPSKRQRKWLGTPGTFASNSVSSK